MAQIPTADILEFHALEQVPDPFIGVQLWRIAWELHEMQTLGCPFDKEGFHDLPPMNRRAIPDHDQLAGKLAKQESRGAARHPRCRRHGPGPASRAVHPG